MKSLTDAIIEVYDDLIKEVPEAEQAIRDYRALRNRQSRNAAAARMRERERQMREEAWDALRDRMRASGIGSDSIH